MSTPPITPVLATFVHIRGKNFGSGLITHVPAQKDWVELGDEVYVVKHLIWNLLVDPHLVEIQVDHVEEAEPVVTGAIVHNMDLIKKLSETGEDGGA